MGFVKLSLPQEWTSEAVPESSRRKLPKVKPSPYLEEVKPIHAGGPQGEAASVNIKPISVEEIEIGKTVLTALILNDAKPYRAKLFLKEGDQEVNLQLGKIGKHLSFKKGQVVPVQVKNPIKDRTIKQVSYHHQ